MSALDDLTKRVIANGLEDCPDVEQAPDARIFSLGSMNGVTTFWINNKIVGKEEYDSAIQENNKS